MGVVYRARHSVTERPVAIKTVFAPASRWMESIRREIDALTRIRHPGIVRILDHGLHEGRPWYAMDLLEGESLRHFGARIWSPYRTPSAAPGPIRPLTVTEPVSRVMESAGKPERASPRPQAGDSPAAANSLPQVLGLMRRLCAALAFLHGEGIVSCDLKPENILLVGLTPVLIDFGLSCRFPGATGRESLDGQRSLAGTLPYVTLSSWSQSTPLAERRRHRHVSEQATSLRSTHLCAGPADAGSCETWGVGTARSSTANVWLPAKSDP